MMSFAVSTIVKVTLVCGLAFLLARLCRHTRASIRHLLFALAFTALVAIPGAGPVLPTVAVTIPAMSAARGLQTQNTASPVPSSANTAPSASGAPSTSRDAAPTRAVSIAQAVTATWLVGVALFLMAIVVGLWQVRRLRQSASPWIDGQAVVETLAPTLGVRRPIDALIHEGVTGPMTCGVLKPAIILPRTAEQWSEATLKRALRHELEHIARWDFLTHCLSRTICAAYWFHPLVWATWRRLRLEAERACDDAVLREDDARDYASLLVSIAQGVRTDTREPLLAMAGRDDLAARVAAVLNDDQVRGRVGRGRATGLLIAWGIVVFSIAPLTIERGRAQTQATLGNAPIAQFETASIERSLDSDVPSRVELRAHAGGLIGTNVTARLLLFMAFGHPNGVRESHQIENAPDWVDSDRFDIVAKAPSGATPRPASETLQSLLAERFKLVAHFESRDFPIYSLVLARQGRLGPRLTPAHIDCRFQPGESSTCGLSSTGAGRVAGRGVTMAQLVRFLPTHLGNQVRFDRPVIDRTGLSGTFDFALEWTPDPVAQEVLLPNRAVPRLSQERAYAFPLELNAPHFLEVLREELGLQLENQLAPEPVLVIDKIEPPTEN